MQEKISSLPFNGDFAGKDFISVDQITSRDEIDHLFAVADEMREIVDSKQSGGQLSNRGVALLFYQPSTRTYSSFASAAQWLGCQRILGIQKMAQFSSAVKGESLPDTIRSIEQTTACNGIVLRHPDDNSSQVAARAVDLPIINAGSGRAEHPTQAVLDLYTIQSELGRRDNLSVTMIGDLVNGRTIKSLAILLTLSRDIEFNFVAPEVLKMPDEVTHNLKAKGFDVNQYGNDGLERVMPDTDVLYVTRIQSEWFDTLAGDVLRGVLDAQDLDVSLEELDPAVRSLAQKEYQKATANYVVSKDLLDKAKKDMIVMHPLPRVGEIDVMVDTDPRAAYFRQMRSGLLTRMAILSQILK